MQDKETVIQLLQSGLEINTSKTEAMWLEQWRKNQETPFGFKWPKDPINSIGIYFSYDQACADEHNSVGAKVRELGQTLQTWQKRKLTLYGKNTIVKTLGLSKMIYYTAVFSVPDQYIKQINNIIFNFIWDGKPAKIKKSTIIAERTNGGLKICDFSTMEKALKITWVYRVKEHLPPGK